jgi:uncharacterized membrane protein
MKNRIAVFFEDLRENFWLLPLIMVIAAFGMSLGLVYIDREADAEIIQEIHWFYTGGATGARDLLSTVATAMMTVAGVTFSITIVALSNASAQFGPRLLRNFMRDTGNQLTLGTFVSTFIYCLMVLRTVRSADEDYFVPYRSVTMAIVLSIAGIMVLIYFIHHVSSSINADNVISLIHKDIDNAIDRLYPEQEDEHQQMRDEKDEDEEETPGQKGEKGLIIRARKSGYVQGIDYDTLMEIANADDLIMEVVTRAGLFIDRDSEMIRIWPKKELNDSTQDDVESAVLIGPRRARAQDVEYEINQLVEIAVRALSPSLNDPFTAMAVVDQLGVALSKMAERNIPPSHRYDGDGNLRLVLNTVTFRGIIKTSFNQIRQFGRESISVVIRLLETLTVIANHTGEAHKHEALKQQGDMIWNSSQEVVMETSDLEDIRSRYLSLLKAVGHYETRPTYNE